MSSFFNKYKIHNIYIPVKTIIKTYYGVFYLIIQSKIPTFTPLEQGKFLSEKHRNEAGAEVGAFLGGLL